MLTLFRRRKQQDSNYLSKRILKLKEKQQWHLDQAMECQQEITLESLAEYADKEAQKIKDLNLKTCVCIKKDGKVCGAKLDRSKGNYIECGIHRGRGYKHHQDVALQ